jgi:membrane protein
MAVFMVVVAGLVLFATALLSIVMTVLHTHFAAVMPAIASPLWRVPQLLVTFVAAAVLFSLMFTTLPSVRIHKRDAWMAGAVTAALFTLGELAIGTYLAVAAPGSVYGAAGSLLVVMVWAYYSAQVFYFGAELMKVSARRAGRYVTPEAAKPLVAERIAARAQSLSSRWLRHRASSKR